MFLSMIEYAVPKPLPFMRIGFANMSVMIAIFILTPWQSFILVLLKVLVQSIISGTLFSYIFIFSFCGSFFALFFMLLVKSLFKKNISFVGISLAGSLGNNLAQIGLSYAMIFKESTGYIAPVLLISGLISSIVLGIFTEIFTEKSVWFSKMMDNKEFAFTFVCENDACCEDKPEIVRRKTSAKTVFTQLLRDLILILSIVIFSLLVPSGKVLYRIGNFALTQNALFLGLKRALILVLSVEISRLVIPNRIVLKGRIGNFINLIFIYFKKLSEFEISGKANRKKILKKQSENPQKYLEKDIPTDSESKPKIKNAGLNFTQRLDSYLMDVCF